jgi:hypothetical protein
MDLIMSRNEINDEVLTLSRNPKLGVLDAVALASLLIGIAAILVRHSQDAELVAHQTGRLLDRMTHAGNTAPE